MIDFSNHLPRFASHFQMFSVSSLPHMDVWNKPDSDSISKEKVAPLRKTIVNALTCLLARLPFFPPFVSWFIACYVVIIIRIIFGCPRFDMDSIEKFTKLRSFPAHPTYSMCVEFISASFLLLSCAIFFFCEPQWLHVFSCWSKVLLKCFSDPCRCAAAVHFTAAGVCFSVREYRH